MSELDVAIVRPTTITITGSGTSFANMALCGIFTLTDVAAWHREFNELQRIHGFGIRRTNGFLKTAKQLYHDAMVQHLIYSALFDEYYQMLKHLDGKKYLSAEDKTTIEESYIIRNRITTMWYRSTEMSQYISACISIRNHYDNCKMGYNKDNITIYL